MPSNYKTAVAPRNAALDAVAGRLDLGRIEIRNSGPPATTTAASLGTLLSTLTLGNPGFGAASNGVVTAQPIASDTNAAASGSATSFRIYENGAADNAPDSQGTAGDAGDTPDMEFDNKVIVLNGTVAISALTITLPEQ